MRVRVDSLSTGQRDCLRLVNAHHSSKEIARKLGISRYTVDQRLAIACRKLGVSSRRDAAVAFALYETFIYERSDIAIPEEQEPSLPNVHSKVNGENGPANTIVSDSHHDGTVPAAEEAPNVFPFPRRKGDRNDLSIPARLAWAFAIFVVAILVSGALIAALEVLGRIL